MNEKGVLRYERGAAVVLAEAVESVARSGAEWWRSLVEMSDLAIECEEIMSHCGTIRVSRER